MTTICSNTTRNNRLILCLATATCFVALSRPLRCAVDLKPLPGDVTHTAIAGDPDPAFSGGAVLKVAANRTRSPEIQILDLNSHLIGNVELAIPEARSVIVYAFARGSKGDLAVSGYSIAEDGRVAEFINFIDSSGGNQRIVRTDPFVPRSIALASDGTVWATGNVSHSKAAPADLDPTRSVLRHFDQSGRLLESFFPEADIHDPVRVMQGQVATASNRVGWISSGNYKAKTGRSGSYVEIDAAGKLQEYPLPPLAPEPGARVVALALTSGGAAFATAIQSAGSLQVFKLDRGSRSWNPVTLTGTSATPFLLGASGETLAFWNSSESHIRFFDTARN
jgi:hypothetical protein